jgi:hypothetical protein
MVIHHMTKGTQAWGMHLILYKSGFLYIVFFLIDYMPVNDGFSPFLGDIGHFWSPNFGRKLGMDNQLQIYINQAFLRPWEDIQSTFMLKGSQAKAIFMQGSY